MRILSLPRVLLLLECSPRLAFAFPHTGRKRLPDSWLFLASTCALLLAAAGCAKVGEPHPPVLLIPKAATDLTARQYGDRIVLTVHMPVQNTNGMPVTTLKLVEVFRITAARGQLLAPLPEDEFMKRGEKVIEVGENGFSTYVHDNVFVFRDTLPPGEQSAVYRSSFDYAVRFVNRKGQAAGLSNQTVISPVAIPPAPVGLIAKVTQEFIALSWDPPAQNMDGSVPPHIAGYDVYRSEDPQRFPPAPLNAEPLQKPEYEDRTFQFDKTYYYSVSVVGSRQNPYAESAASAPVEVAARDVFPPEPPQNLNAVVENGAVILLWVAPPDPDVAGYRIYRRVEGETEKTLLQPALVNALSFRDDKVQTGKKYEYQVTAVDTHGNESAPAQTSVEVQ